MDRQYGGIAAYFAGRPEVTPACQPKMTAATPGRKKESEVVQAERQAIALALSTW
jgi:hypothetical protein